MSVAVLLVDPFSSYSSSFSSHLRAAWKLACAAMRCVLVVAACSFSSDGMMVIGERRGEQSRVE